MATYLHLRTSSRLPIQLLHRKYICISRVKLFMLPVLEQNLELLPCCSIGHSLHNLTLISFIHVKENNVWQFKMFCNEENGYFTISTDKSNYAF